MRLPLTALIAALVCAWVSMPVSAQMTEPPALYITPSDGFEVYLAAAMHKKRVPIRAVTQSRRGDLHPDHDGD